MIWLNVFLHPTWFFGASCDPSGGGQFFFFPHWWEYIKTGEPDLVNSSICQPVPHLPGDIWAILMAVVDMLLRAAGLVAVISIIVSGVIYITAGGNAEKTVSARSRIYNSMIGLAIVIIAAGLVRFIGLKLG